MFASLLTLSRFLLALWVFHEVVQQGRYSFASFLIAMGALTDFLDGWVARRFGQSSRLGAHLDHIGDKFFVVVVFTAFDLTGRVDFLPLMLLAVREVLIALFRFYGLAGAVNGFGKVKTAAEFAALLLLCYNPFWGNLLLWVAVFLAYCSAVLYLKKPLRVGF